MSGSLGVIVRGGPSLPCPLSTTAVCFDAGGDKSTCSSMCFTCETTPVGVVSQWAQDSLSEGRSSFKSLLLGGGGLAEMSEFPGPQARSTFFRY